MPELTPQQIADYNRLKTVEGKLLKNPTVRKKFFKVYKEADPEARIPELEQDEANEAVFNEQNAALKDELKELRSKIIQREAEEANSRERERLTKAPYNLTQSEIDEVIQLRADKHAQGELLSLETCAQVYLHAHVIPAGQARPRLPFSTKGQRPKNDFRKQLRDPKSELFKDPRGYVQKQADEAREELREAFGECLV